MSAAYDDYAPDDDSSDAWSTSREFEADGFGDDGFDTPLPPEPPASSLPPAPPEPPTAMAPADRVRRHLLGALIAFVVVALVLVGSIYWYEDLRTVTARVNGVSYSMRASTSISQLLNQHHDFGKKRGNLMSVTGKLLTDGGSKAVKVTVDGTELAPSSWDQHVFDGANIVVSNGANACEPSKKIITTIPAGVELKTGGAVQFISKQGVNGQQETLIGLKSGERVNKGIIKKPVATVVDSLTPNPVGKNKGAKYVALTFDDGPSKYTPQYLAILKQYGAHATFFDVGQWAKLYPQYERDVIAAGDEIGNHSWDHPLLTELNAEQARQQITSTSNVIRENIGSKAPIAMLRAPYGAYSEQMWANLRTVISSNVLWTIDTRDWALPGADAIVAAATTNVQNGSIILMHDGGGNRDEDLKALPQILQKLKDQGFTFVTMKQMMSMDSRFPKAVADGELVK